ncbi:MAG: hypothetical protein HY761_04690 [Candidatus Omnitrophica bacterium]|nr:hypothetical protein [Candidatus Omnitrophota bacterium]
MKRGHKACTSQQFFTVFALLSISLIAFFSFKDMLQYFFRGDDLQCIHQGRVHDLGDISRIFTERFLETTGIYHLLYRPVMILSFSIDYSIWKLNPFGYHLTNLLIHILVSISVFFLARLLTGGKQFIAWISAVIFTTHPVNMYSVTAVGMRADLMSPLFSILSLLLFLKHLSVASYRRFFLLSSIFLYILAFWSKETAIIFPVLVFAYLIIFSEEASPKFRTVQAIKKVAPYFIVTFILFIWRLYILKSLLGGYHEPLVRGFRSIIFEYFYYLLTPGNLINLNTSTLGLFVTILPPLIISLMLYSKLHQGKLKLVGKLLIIGLILSTISIPVYLIVEQLIARLTENNYLGIAHQLFEGKNITSWINYLNDERGSFLNRFYFFLYFFFICLICVGSYEQKRIFFPLSYKNKLIVFLIIWLSLLLSLYLLTLYLANWHMYFSVIPFSILLSFILFESFQSIKEACSSRLFLFKPIAIPLVMGILMLLLFFNSPFTKIKGWRPETKSEFIFFKKFSEIVYSLPNNTTTIYVDVPNKLCLSEDIIKTWLDLIHPANKVKAIFLNTVPATITTMDYLDFEIQLMENNEAKINGIR